MATKKGGKRKPAKRKPGKAVAKAKPTPKPKPKPRSPAAPRAELAPGATSLYCVYCPEEHTRLAEDLDYGTAFHDARQHNLSTNHTAQPQLQ